MPAFFELTSIDFPEITLIPLTLDYAPGMYKLIANNREFLSQHGDTTGSKYQTIDDYIESIERPENPRKERYTILSRGIIAGSINLTPVNEQIAEVEIGYWLGREFTGKGIAYSGAKMLSDHALGRENVEEVIAHTRIMNTASARTLLKAGFEYIATEGVGEEKRKKFAKS